MLTAALRRLPVRRFATTAASLAQEQAIAKNAYSRLANFLGTAAILTTAVAFAPPDEFDNLDCQSYCQRFLTDDVVKPSS